MLPIQMFLRGCRKRLFSFKIADSSGISMTGGRLLAAALVMHRMLIRKGIVCSNHNMVGVLLPPSIGAVLANMGSGGPRNETRVDKRSRRAALGRVDENLGITDHRRNWNSGANSIDCCKHPRGNHRHPVKRAACGQSWKDKNPSLMQRVAYLQEVFLRTHD